MRISDWSSDVCSSDLAQARDEDLAPAELAAHIEEKHHGYLHAELPLLVALADKVASVHGERHAELAEVARLVTTVREIGRASCRERVCQYVSIPVVAES